ncbi:MAG: hypothetical protein RL379_827 [Bacillota bacterium]|jgi:hypothetical protein
MQTILSFGIDPGQIAQYLDYALYGIFGMVALGFILGFLRGIWREGFRLFFVGGLVIASVLFTRQIVDFAMDFDISSLASSAGFSSISLNLNGAPIIVAVTTPYETIYEILEQSLLAFGFFITPAIADLIIGLTLVILRYLVFIVLAVIIFFLGETIAAILYFIPFRFLIPRNLRKKAKMRLFGALAGALKMVLVLTMFLSPFTSLVNTITGSFKDFDDEYGDQIDGELYNEIMSFVNAYNDSTFAQTLFSWSLTDDGLSIDTALMDYVTGQDLDAYRLTLANELGSFVDIAATLIGSGAVDSTFSTIDTSLLITEDVVNNLITSLTGSVLIMKILPIAVTIGLNLDEVSAYLDSDLITLDDLVWEEELQYLGDIFTGVIRSGVLTPILEGNTDTLTLLNSMFTAQAKDEVIMMLETLDESPFLSQVIPAVLYQLVTDEVEAGGPAGGIGLSTFLPTEWSEYESISFGSELSLIYELVYELNEGVDGLLDVVLPMNQDQVPFGRKAVDEPTPTLIDLLKDHFDLFVEILIGEVDEDGLPINNDPTTGKAINRRSLLDSDLIVNGLPSIVEDLLLPTLTSVAGAEFDDTELNELISDFNAGTSGDIRIDYKDEFGGIFSILGAVLGNETLISLIQPEPGQTLDILALLEDGEFRLGLKADLIPSLDRSQIILTVVPGILESTLTGAGFDDFLSLISLTTADLNFDFESLSRELTIVVDMMGYAFNVLDASSDLLNQFPTIAYDLIGLLDNIYYSDIINLNPDTNNKTTNFNQIIKGIFSLVEGIGIEETDIDTGFNRVGPSGLENGWTTTFIDTNGNDKLDELDTISFRGENFHLINFLKTALESGLLDISGDLFAALEDLTTGSEDIDDPEVATLYKIFAYADRSEIIAAAFGGILDNLFGSTGGLLDPDLGTSFRNVTSWTEEGSNLMYLVKQLTNFADGLENIDFLNSDVTMIEELLQGLAASQIFIKPNGDYVFPDFLLDQLTGIADLASYFEDPSPYQSTWDDNPADNFTIVTEDFYAISNQTSTRANWYGVKTMITDINNDPILDVNGDIQYEYVGGELENIVGFIAELQSVSITDLTSGTGLNGQTISDVLLALNNASSLRVLVFNVYDSIFGGSNFDIGSLSLSQTNTFVFLDLNQAGRAQQIQATADLLDTISDMGLDGGGAFDIANFDESTILTVGDLLTILHDAALFNSFKLGRSRTNGDLTVFEQAYQFLLTTATLDTFIYDGLTEVQTEAALYQDMTSLDNNFGTETPDDWDGIDGEIQRFVDIMVAFVNTGIDFTNFGGDAIGDLLNTEVGLGKVEDLLLSMNESTIISPAIGNLFGNVFGSDAFNIGGLTMSDANTNFFNQEPLKVNRATEISLILDIYWDINSIGITGGAAFSADLIDPVLFDALLNKMHDSNVFNSFKSGNSYLLDDLTIFEQTVRMILNTSTLDTFIYDEPINANRLLLLQDDIADLENNFGNGLTDDDWTGNNGEINQIIGILESFKETDIDFANFGGDAISDLLSTGPGLAKVENLLLSMNNSTLVAPSIGNLFGNIFDSDSFNINGLTMSDANTNYFNVESSKIDRGQEISQILDIYSDINAIGLTGGTAFTSELINPVLFNDLLNKMHDSYVFNSFKTGNSYANNNLTIFEQTVRMIINTSTLDTFVFDGESNTNRLNYLQDDISVIPNNFAVSINPDSWKGSTGEISKIISILEAFKDLDLDFASFSGAGSSDTLSNLIDTPVGLAKIENLLLSMNNSTIVYPAIPNLFSNMLEGGDFSSVGVDFTLANFRYRGTRNDPNNLSVGDQYMPYDNAEISAILSIFSDVKVVGNRAYGSIKDLSDQAIDDMANLVRDLHDSQVFHLTGPSTADADDLTIFEQMMAKMFKDTGMASLAYDAARLADAVYGNANAKADALVLNYVTLFPTNNSTHLTDNWLDDENVGEINAFFRIFKELKVALPNLGNASSIDAGALSPSSIGRIMSVLNYSSLTADAVKKMVKDAFSSINFGTYTENNETYELTPVQFLSADINVMNYSTLPGTVISSGLIDGLLNSFYDQITEEYISISGGFNVSNFLADGGSLYPLVNLLSNSQIFGNNATKILNPDATNTGLTPFNVTTIGSFKTRSLTFYNFLNTASVSKYFDYLTTLASDKELKVIRVEEIFSGDFDEVFEASRLDQFIGVISNFTSLSDASSLDQYSSEMRSLIDLTYMATGQTIIDRAFMVSELSAGFFTDIFKGEYAIVEDTNAIFFGDANNISKQLNFYDLNQDGNTDFELLNPIEAIGLEGSLEFLSAIKGVSGTPNSSDITAMKAALIKMGSRISLNVTGGPYPTATNYAGWSNTYLSKVGQLFYAARIVTNSGFDGLSALIVTVTTPNPFTNPSGILTTLSQEPYELNFVFEIEGEKIEYAFNA